MNPQAGASTEITDTILDVLKVGVGALYPKSLIADAKLSVEQVGSFIGESLFFKLQRSLLAHKVMTDNQNVFFETPAVVAVPVHERYWKWYFIPWKRTVTKTVRTTVTGNVNVECSYFNTFPEAAIDYPKELGKPVRYTEFKSRPVR